MKLKKIKFFLRNPAYTLAALRNKLSPIYARKPLNNSYTYSDLFIWRSDYNLITFYEYTPYIDIINPNFNRNSNEVRKSRIVILNSQGKLIDEKIIKTNPFEKNIININQLFITNKSNNTYGSFLIFHKDIPPYKYLGEGFLTDRGYTSYKRKDTELRSYAHGNLDAIAGKYNFKGINKITYTKQTYIKRIFKLQYLFKKLSSYQLGFVNPTINTLFIKMYIISEDSRVIDEYAFNIESLGTYILNIPKLDENYYIRLKSKFPMCRPFIYKFLNDKIIDVMHG